MLHTENIPPMAIGDESLVEHLLTIQDLARMLKLPVSWVREHVRAGARDRIPGFKLGKYWRFRREDIFAWLNQRSV